MLVKGFSLCHWQSLGILGLEAPVLPQVSLVAFNLHAQQELQRHVGEVMGALASLLQETEVASLLDPFINL